MFQVLRHYLPAQKALLVFSETLILFGVNAAGLTMHLWRPTRNTYVALAHESLSLEVANQRCLVAAFLFAVIGQVAISFNELYDIRRSTSSYTRAQGFIVSAGSAIFLTLTVYFVAEVSDLGPLLDVPGLTTLETIRKLIFVLVVGFGCLWTWRSLFHWALRKAGVRTRWIALSSGEHVAELALEIEDHPAAGVELVGLLATDFEPTPDPRLLPNVRLTEDGLEGGGTLFGLAESNQVSELVLPPNSSRTPLPTDELLRCRLAGISVRSYESAFELVSGKVPVQALRAEDLRVGAGYDQQPGFELAKRALDIFISIVGIAITLPVQILTIIAVRLDSKGPALFLQDRVGRDGLNFTLYKFRSMRADAEDESGPVWATDEDPRVTRVGSFLRRSRIDEIPQLYNVLVGDMSLVGPRPEREHFVDQLAEDIPWFRQRHLVKPGVTGWAQINYPYGNTAEDARQKLQFDLFYIKYSSLLFDLSILINTAKTVVLRRGT
jgi:exopolysaccharide biosynthesis polyprenyl glycosylphosphotransferase